MTVFTIIGLLWFWLLCFQVGYYAAPATQLAWTAILLRRMSQESAALTSEIVYLVGRAANSATGRVKEADRG